MTGIWTGTWTGTWTGKEHGQEYGQEHGQEHAQEHAQEHGQMDTLKKRMMMMDESYPAFYRYTVGNSSLDYSIYFQLVLSSWSIFQFTPFMIFVNIQYTTNLSYISFIGHENQQGGSDGSDGSDKQQTTTYLLRTYLHIHPFTCHLPSTIYHLHHHLHLPPTTTSTYHLPLTHSLTPVSSLSLGPSSLHIEITSKNAPSS